MTLFLVAVATALGISALCSLLEAVLLSVTPSQIADLSARQPRVAAIWENFKLNIEKPIAVILIVNTAAHTIGASVAGAEFERLYGEKWLLPFSLLLTYLMLQFTEILPKTLGVSYNMRLAPTIAVPLQALVRALAPFLRLIHWINRPFERKKTRPGPSRVIEEIQALASIARTTGSIDPHQARLIQAAYQLPQLRVRQIMTPRIDVGYLRVDQPMEDVLKTVRNGPWSRWPLCDGDFDNVLGLIHVRDLFNALQLERRRLNLSRTGPSRGESSEEPLAQAFVVASGEIDLRKIMRPILTVPEKAPVSGLLRQFQESRIQMAVLVDEYGVSEGIITLEDILEEVVGEIEDEFDRKSRNWFVAEGDCYRVSGNFPLHELRTRTDLELETGEVDTIGGYIVQELGRLPAEGDLLQVGSYQARVLSVDGWRVTEIELRPSAGGTGGTDRSGEDPE